MSIARLNVIIGILILIWLEDGLYLIAHILPLIDIANERPPRAVCRHDYIGTSCPGAVWNVVDSRRKLTAVAAFSRQCD